MKRKGHAYHRLGRKVDITRQRWVGTPLHRSSPPAGASSWRTGELSGSRRWGTATRKERCRPGHTASGSGRCWWRRRKPAAIMRALICASRADRERRRRAGHVGSSANGDVRGWAASSPHVIAQRSTRRRSEAKASSSVSTRPPGSCLVSGRAASAGNRARPRSGRCIGLVGPIDPGRSTDVTRGAGPAGLASDTRRRRDPSCADCPPSAAIRRRGACELPGPPTDQRMALMRGLQQPEVRVESGDPGRAVGPTGQSDPDEAASC